MTAVPTGPEPRTDAAVNEPFDAEELCRCGHEHLRHDMGHGCIECRCRRFREPRTDAAVGR